MIKRKIDKETAIKSILSDLKKGIDKKSIFGRIRKNSEIPKSTIYDWYRVAETKYKEFLSVANPIIEAKEIEALGQIAVSNILSKLERQLLLSDIARGNVKVWKEALSKDGKVKLSYYDPVKYINELNKMDGAYIEDQGNDNDITEIKITRIGSIT
jgi:hypothetical protein